jgi:LysR family transcriptional regulator, hydrogen peroxide-inducible genes activator
VNFLGLSLRDLEYVLAVAQAGSFTAAAEACAVSQPSLSMQIRKVEDRLGVVLFERTRRDVRITPAGEIIIRQAQAVLGEARRLLELARGLQDPLVGPLRLGAIATLGPYLIPHLLSPLRQRYPDLKLLLHEGLTAELVGLVLAGEVDAVLLSLPVEEERIATAPVLFEPFVAICSDASPLAAQEDVELADLDTDDLVLMDEGHCIRAQALALCNHHSDARGVRHVASLETLRHLVAAGAGHSLLPRLAAREDPLLAGHIRYRPFSDPEIGRSIGLAWRGTDPRGAAFQELAAFIRSIPIEGARSIP